MKPGFVNRIIIAVLASLGFASCEPEHPDLYGCPVIDYNEECAVTAEQQDGDTVATENTEKE